MASWLNWKWMGASVTKVYESAVKKPAVEEDLCLEDIDSTMNTIRVLDKYGVSTVAEKTVNIGSLIAVYATDAVFYSRLPERAVEMFESAVKHAANNTGQSVLLITYPNESIWDAILERRQHNLKVVAIYKT